MRWHKAEEKYLRILHDICNGLSKEYMELYTLSHSFQTKLRIPAIILSSCSGVASFGSSGFGTSAQRYISLGVGIVNVGIAILQTYESYIKISDIVSKSLSCSIAFKKLADCIYCEIFIPTDNRIANGITFLRDCFTKYQAILEQAPPLEFHGKKPTDLLDRAHDIAERLKNDMASPTVKRYNMNNLATIEDVEDLPSTASQTNERQDEPHQSNVFIDMKTLMQQTHCKVLSDDT